MQIDAVTETIPNWPLVDHLDIGNVAKEPGTIRTMAQISKAKAGRPGKIKNN